MATPCDGGLAAAAGPVQTPAMNATWLSLQEATAGRFAIERELGRGGMGIVYLARELQLDRLVAIKLLPPAHAAVPARRARFLREARLAAGLSHPGIIPIHAVEERGDCVFFVMAFIDGVTLTQRVRTRGPLAGAEGIRLLRDVAFALAYAHQRGVVHRDVKPDNILIEAGTGRVFVADFGIAGVGTDDVNDGVAGTPEFASPEQALGAAVGPPSDVYSLGATAFFALSGHCPFEGGTATEILARHVTEAPPRLATMGTSAPRAVAALVDRCLVKDPAGRPQTAQEIAEAMGTAIEQRREVPVVLRAFVRRHGRLDGPGTISGVAIGAAAATMVGAFAGVGAALATLTVAVTAVPFTYLADQARRLARRGFAHSDLALAFADQLDAAREELAVQGVRPPGLGDRILGPLTRWSAVAATAAVATMFAVPDAVAALAPAAVVAYSAAILGGIAALSRAQQRRDLDTEFWRDVWNGPIGRAAFAVGRRLVRGAVPAAAMTHRATELSLGLAAEGLFQQLPPAVRASIGDVPGVVARLQRDAQRLRERLDDLQGVVATAGAEAGVPEALAARDATRDQLAEAIAALEGIRLNLLRLHAGTATPAHLSTHLGDAREVADAVERLLAGRDEVDALLRFPREATPTPA
jgi:serine/threonine-protein kinase